MSKEEGGKQAEQLDWLLTMPAGIRAAHEYWKKHLKAGGFGFTVRVTLGEPSLEQLADRLAEELRRALVDSVDAPARSMRVPLGEGTEVLGALWGAIARVQDRVPPLGPDAGLAGRLTVRHHHANRSAQMFLIEAERFSTGAGEIHVRKHLHGVLLPAGSFSSPLVRPRGSSLRFSPLVRRMGLPEIDGDRSGLARMAEARG